MPMGLHWLESQQPKDRYGNRLTPGAVQYGQGDFRGSVHPMEMPALNQSSEGEFEEIMSKNKNVLSSAATEVSPTTKKPMTGITAEEIATILSTCGLSIRLLGVPHVLTFFNCFGVGVFYTSYYGLNFVRSFLGMTPH